MQPQYATVAQLGARALRKLGFAIVAESSRPPSGPPYTMLQLAQRVIRDSNIPIAEDARPALLGTTGQADLAARALRAVGINPLADAVPSGLVVGVTEIARRALVRIGVNPSNPGPGNPTGITLSLEQLATTVLAKLAVIASDETPQPNDQMTALGRLETVHDALTGQGLVTAPAGAIPASLSDYYVMMAANLVAPDFGLIASPDAYQAAEAAIRTLALTGPVAQTRAEAQVQSTHDALLAEGLADWPVAAIPDALADAYAALAAHVMAPAFGGTADAAGYEAAMGQVRRQALSGPRGQALAADKVAAVHDGLVVQGLVSWPLTAVPLAFSEDYTIMAAVLLGPVMESRQEQSGEQSDRAAWEAAEAHIRRAGMVAGAQDRAADKLQSIQAELAALGLVSWTPDAVPDFVADALAELASLQMGVEFGRDPDPKAYAVALARVRRISMGGTAGQALAEQKVRAVHTGLEARGLVRWTVYSIPSFAEESYVFLAAVLLSPECEPPSPANPNWTEMAERDLARFVSLPSEGRPVVACYF